MQQYEHRRPNRRDKQKSAVRKAIGVLIGLVVVIGVVGYFYMSARANIRPLDSVTFCPTDSQGPNSVTDVLFDETDSFNLTQQAAIRDRLNDLRDHMARYDMLEIYTVEPTKTKLLQPEFSMCNPGRGEEISKWTGNPRIIEERWEKLFAEPLQHLFDLSLTGGTAAISPIMESIQSIVVTRLGAQTLISKKIPRKLIIISDLLQYTKEYSQYRPIASFSQFSMLPYYQSVRSDMSGLSIEIWYIRRKATLALQGDAHMDFWRDYLSDQGGIVEKVWMVPGI